MRRGLLIAQFVVLALIARNWAYVTTYRLYLERRLDPPARSAAAEQFEIENGRVVPRIVARGGERLAFATDAGDDAHVRVQFRPVHTASYEIVWRVEGAPPRTLARGRVSDPTDIDAAYPTGRGVIELSTDDAAVWADPRVVRDFTFGRHAVALALLFAGWWLGRRRGKATPTPLTFRFAAAALGALCALIASEAALRALGDAMPAGLATERHDLGEVTRDPQWEDTPRYGRRLRANVDTLNEWRYGDVVRLGYVPASVSGATLHQFPFHTDAEGFRNASVRSSFDIAALGDSFTDAMTMRVEDSWPAQLERLLSVPVQNYGTAGFGPQQELLVLKDYVTRHRPRCVVLAYFAGNDIFDAEAFDEFQRRGAPARTPPGWRIKDVVSRADTWFLVSALRSLSRRLDATSNLSASAGDTRPVATSGGTSTATFDRGMFDIPVGDASVRFAFMPPYLNTLNFSAADLRARSGWTLTTDAIREMRDVSRSFGAAFVVMFVPFKSQVYLELADRSFPRPELTRALHFYLDRYGGTVDVRRMLRNRLAQNGLMQQWCDRERIPLLDTTPALEARLRRGENLYFPDESHLNEAGEAAVAEALAAFLKALQLE